MTLRFVKTSILSSNDGIDFGTEVAVESDEVRKTRLEAEAASNKPLYQQLADIRDRKQLEYDENTKKIFAPPKGLDEEDIEFFNEMDDAKARTEDTNKRQEQAELEAFRESRRIEFLKEPQDTPHLSINLLPAKKIEQPLKVGVIVTGKLSHPINLLPALPELTMHHASICTAKRKVANAGTDDRVVSTKKTEGASATTSHKAVSNAPTVATKGAAPPTSTVQSTPSAKSNTVPQAAPSLFAEYDSD